jgi:hypothetical protein
MAEGEEAEDMTEVEGMTGIDVMTGIKKMDIDVRKERNICRKTGRRLTWLWRIS